MSNINRTEDRKNAEVSNSRECLVSCIGDIASVMVRTGEITPAGGVCYEHQVEDCCAAIYQNGRKARFYFNRLQEFVGREKWPCFYNDVKIFIS